MSATQGSGTQRGWSGFGSRKNFMESYGLKIYNQDDCEQARLLLKQLKIQSRSSKCVDCDRKFSCDQALKQHLENSPVHAPKQNLDNSPVHAPSFKCEACDRPFGSKEALDKHMRNSRIHQTALETPLDAFFRSFPAFDYNPSLPPATSYAKLQEHERWRAGTAASADGWDRYQDALESELRMWYGAENNLAAWHALCRAIGVEPLPQTCEKCEEAVRRTHVNIVDLIEWGRRRGRGGTEEKVQIFRNVKELRTYTKDTKKIFRNPFDQESGNVVLRHLLRKIFRGGR